MSSTTFEYISQVHEEMRKAGCVLLIEDSTVMSFSGKKPIPGLGPIGNGSEGLQGPPESARWVRVCDAEADIFEHIEKCQEYGHGFVIRAYKDRALVGTDQHLFSAAHAGTVVGQFTLTLRARDKQPQRDAELTLSWNRVMLRPPYNGKGTGSAVSVNLLWVHERHPVDGFEPLDWILLTDANVDSFEAAREVLLQYSTRWLVEEYHKVLKTGMGAERLQLETADRLMAAMAIMAVVACRLLEIREQARRESEAPAEQSVLTETELRVLEARAGKRLRTVADVALAIGRLGGHLNRKGDGLPGWITLWRGMLVLNNLVAGFLLAQRVQTFRE